MEFRPETVVGLRKPEEIPVEWSEAPGCFERHLQRRYRNPLFPLERRRIAIADVITARARDEVDLKELELRIKSLFEKASTLPDQASFHEGLILRAEVEKLLFRCAEVGAVAAQAKAVLQRVYDSLAEGMREASPPEGRQELDNAFAHSACLQKMQSNEFIAQLTRSDTPISAAEVIPSLLSESVEMIRTYVGFLNKSGRGLDRASVEEATRILGQATKEGYEIAEAQQKLQALHGDAHDAP